MSRGSIRRRQPRWTRVVPWLVVVFFTAYGVLLAVRDQLPAWVPALYLAASIVAFMLYALDKSAAVGGRRRVPERTLLVAGLVGGWPGAVAAQQVRRHKTQKRSFQLAFWASVVVNAAVFVALTARSLP